jgi:group I intron endonuclease
MAETWILYKTTNLVNSKIYVGIHKVSNTYRSNYYLGSGYALKSAIKLYGRENFTRETLAEFNCVEDVYLAEAAMVNQEFINRPDTYNMKIGGIGSKGLVHTPEAKARISGAKKGTVFTPESRAKMSAAQKGKKISEEVKQKISISLKGNKRAVGNKLSDEHKAIISAANKNRPLTPEHKAKIAAASTGRVKSEEELAKMRAANAHKSIAVLINGVYYSSLNAAASREGVNVATLSSRVKSKTVMWSDWRNATEEEKRNYMANKVQ